MLSLDVQKQEAAKKNVSSSIANFSQESITRALGKYARNHWATKYSASVLALSLFSAFLFGFNELVFWAMVASFAATSGSWTWNRFFQAENFSLRYTEDLHKQLEEAAEHKRQYLKQKLIKYGCDRGANQLEKIQEKFDNLVRLLEEKLDPNELTLKRYLGITQAVVLSALDNLTAVASSLMSISEIDVDFIKQRLSRLQRSKNDDTRTKSEAETLQERLQLYQGQLQVVEDLLLENEKALTQLDKTAIAIANLDTGQFRAEIDMEESMRNLIELTNRSTEYGISNSTRRSIKPFKRK